MAELIFTDYDPLEELMPKEGWLYEYVNFSSSLEACTRFRFFTACCMLGAAINNRVFIHRGDADLLPKLFPNPWVLLLAPPGRDHKTSTINMGVNCIAAASPEVRVLADKITPEGLVKALSEPSIKEQIRIGPRDATGLIKAPELSVFFGRQTYNVGLVQLIADLYDYREEWSSDTIMRGKNVLRHNCLSIIGGSTPDWLQTMLPQDAFTGGFMSRFIIVEMPPTYFKRVAKPKRLPGTDWITIVEGLRNFSILKGEMKWTKKGDDFYIEHYEQLKPTGDKQKDAYQERETEQIIRLAMLLSISEGKFKVDVGHMQMAHSFLKCLMTETKPRIERLGTHPSMSLVQEIQDLLKTTDGLTKRSILQRVYRGLTRGEQQFNEALRILCITGVVCIEGDRTNPKYKLTKGE